jgi:hypothetical protein
MFDLGMLYKRKYWYSAQDETFEHGCFVIIPLTCFGLIFIPLLFPLQQAILLGALFLLGAFALLYYRNQRDKNCVQKAFWISGFMMNQIVESILLDKQIPYDKLSKGRKNIYLLNADDIEISVEPYIYTIRRSKGLSTRVEDGILVKIRSSGTDQDLMQKGIKNKIDEQVETMNLA